ncbi:Uncharacterized protein PBTT_07845 [Plasmodiophora brassicae]
MVAALPVVAPGALVWIGAAVVASWTALAGNGVSRVAMDVARDVGDRTVGRDGLLTQGLEHVPGLREVVIEVHKAQGHADQARRAERVRSRQTDALGLAPDGPTTLFCERVPGLNVIAAVAHKECGNPKAAARALGLTPGSNGDADVRTRDTGVQTGAVADPDACDVVEASPVSTSDPLPDTSTSEPDDRQTGAGPATDHREPQPSAGHDGEQEQAAMEEVVGDAADVEAGSATGSVERAVVAADLGDATSNKFGPDQVLARDEVAGEGQPSAESITFDPTLATLLPRDWQDVDGHHEVPVATALDDGSAERDADEAGIVGSLADVFDYVLEDSTSSAAEDDDHHRTGGARSSSGSDDDDEDFVRL